MAITLDERFWSKVNKEAANGCWEWTAGKTAKGYGKYRFNSSDWRAHRLAYTAFYGDVPRHMHVDHMCWNTSCVNPKHLRLLTLQENNQNLSGPRCTSKSGVRGVYWDKEKNRWVGTGRINGRLKKVGFFLDLEEADRVMKAWREEHYPGVLKSRQAA